MSKIRKKIKKEFKKYILQFYTRKSLKETNISQLALKWGNEYSQANKLNKEVVFESIGQAIDDLIIYNCN